MKRTAGMTKTVLVNAAILFLVSVCWAGEQSLSQGQEKTDRKFKESYSVGYEFGTNLNSRGMNTGIDADVLLSAVRDGLEEESACAELGGDP